MTIYQKELLRQLPKLNCTGEFDEESGMLHISLDGIPLCIAGKKCDLYWEQDKLATEKRKEAIDGICNAAHSIREYVSLYEAAPPLGVDSLPEYRRLAEYGDTVLGAMHSERHGFMFSTWKQDEDHGYVVHGEYTTDYESAKESLARRSGLVNETHLYDQKEATDIYAAIEYTRNNCEDLTYEQEEQLKNLQEKLTYGYPDIEKTAPSFEQDDAPQMNM